jgi:hypothetical protein
MATETKSNEGLFWINELAENEQAVPLEYVIPLKGAGYVGIILNAFAENAAAGLFLEPSRHPQRGGWGGGASSVVGDQPVNFCPSSFRATCFDWKTQVKKSTIAPL